MNKSIVNNAIFNILYQFLNICFPMISSMYVSRVLLPEGVGAVVFVQSVTSYFLTLVPLGVTTYGVRVIAQNYGDLQKRSTRFWELMTINGISTVFFGAVYYAYVLLSPQLADNRALFLIAGVQILANAINIDWFYRGMEEYAYITLRSFIVKICSLVALVLFVREKADVAVYLIISTGAICGNHLFNIWHARSFVWKSSPGFSLKGHLMPELVIASGAILANIWRQAPVTMMGYMGNLSSAAYYSNADKVTGMILVICVAVTVAFLPRLSYYYKSDRAQYEELIRKGIQIILLIAVPAVAGIVIIAPVLIPLLFGEVFAPAARTAQLLAPMILIRSLGDLICYQILISTGHERRQTRVCFFAAVLNIALNLVLIPRFSQNGAAVATVCSELLVDLVLLSYTRKIVRIQPGWCNIGKTLLSTALMAASVLAVMHAASGLPAWVQVVAAVGTGIAVFAGSSVVLKNEMAELLLDYLRQRVCRK